MPESGRYVVVYDIEDDRERLRVAKLLEGFGQRVQKSVFECLLTRSSRSLLEAQLDKLGIATGFILIYRLNDQFRRIASGKVPADLSATIEHLAFVV